MKEDFKLRLRGGETLIGTMLTFPSPEVAELLALVGFDWLFVDGEHGPFDTRGMLSVLQAVAGRAACLVRIPAIDEIPIKQALDAGADGIIVPQVQTAEQAQQLARWCRYPPRGSRGIGLARAHGYGTGSAHYLDTANDQVTVVVQAEHRDAVENIDSIAAVDGIDAVLIGPNDLSASYGTPGQLQDPPVSTAINKIETACKSAGMPLGIFGASAEAVTPFLDRGFRLIVVGVDALLLGGAAHQLLYSLRSGSAG